MARNPNTWFSLQQEIMPKYITDAIPCINPFDILKGGKREIDLVQDQSTRVRNWTRLKEHYHIKKQENVEFYAIKNSLSMSTFFRAVKIYSTIGAINCLKKIKKLIARFN